MQIGKRVTAVFIAMCILLTYISVIADNSQIYDDTNTFAVSISDGKAAICGFCPQMEPTVPTELTIPSSITVGGVRYPVSEVADKAFYLKNNIKYLVVEQGVERIGVSAFETNLSLVTVELPDSIKKIDNKAFKSCTNIRRISLGNGVEYIGYEVFHNFKKVSCLVIPASVTYFSWLAFNYSGFSGTVIFLSDIDFESTNRCSTIGKNIKFIVRTESQKKHLINNCGISSDRITVSDARSTYLLPGYNGGEPKMLGGSSVELPAPDSRAQFEFAGWENSDGKIYLAGETYSPTADADILTAKWNISNSTKRITDTDMESAVGYTDQLASLINKDETVLKKPSAKTTVNINVDEQNIVRKTEKRNLGIQYEAAGSDMMLNLNTHDLSQEYLDIADDMFDVPLVRWGGGSANSINLWKSIVPYDSREANYYVNDLYEVSNVGLTIPADKKAKDKVNLGPVEFINSVLKINPDAEFIFCIGIYVTTADDVENFIHFLVDPADKWASMRETYGLISGRKPVNLVGLELGNEVWGDKTRKAPENAEGEKIIETVVERYSEISREYIEVIKKARTQLNRSIDIITVAPADYSFWHRTWNRYVIRKLRPYDDGIYALHTYAYTVTAEVINDIADDITGIYREEIGYETSPRYYVTEHALWDGVGYAGRLVSMYSALSEVVALNTMMLRPDILGANYHSMTGSGLWRMLQDKDGKLVLSANALVYKEYLDCLGDRIVGATYDDLIYDNLSYTLTPSLRTADYSASVLVTAQGSDTLKVIAVSHSLDEIKDTTLNFNFKNKYDLTSAKVFTAPNMQSYIADGIDDAISCTETISAPIKDATSYTLAPQSVAFLTFKLTSGSIGTEPAEQNFSIAENVMYRNLLDGATNDGEGVYSFAVPSEISRIVTAGATADTVIKAKNAFGKWVVLSSGTVSNQGYCAERDVCEYYDAVSISGIDASNVLVLSELDTDGKINTVASAESFCIYPHINGEDRFNDASISTNGFFKQADGTIKGGSNILGEVSASYGGTTLKARVLMTTKNQFFAYDDDFESYTCDDTKYGGHVVSGETTADGQWRLTSASNTSLSLASSFGIVNSDLYNNDGMKFDDVNGDCLVLFDSFSTRGDVARYPSLTYTGNMKSAGNAFRIRARITRTSGGAEYGIKFLVHNDGNNFYALIFDSWSSKYTSPLWTLWKVENGIAKRLVNGVSLGTQKSPTMDICITYDGGVIKWTSINSNGRQLSDKCGSYTDLEPFTAEGSTFGFCCNGTKSNEYRGMIIDDISVRALDATTRSMTIEYDIADTSVDYSGPLNFELNSAEHTAAVTGIDNGANMSDADIPRTVCFGGEAYTVTSIADEAFAGTAQNKNTVITNVTLPSTIKSIGTAAFAYCTSLKPIKFPESLKSIGERAFIGCTSFKELGVLPQGVVLGKRAFDSITFTTDAIVIPGSTKFGTTFKSARAKAVVLGEGIETLASEEFYSNRTMTQVFLPSTMNKISTLAFNSADKLRDIYVLSDNVKFDFNKLGTNAADGEITIHTVSESAFSEAQKLVAADNTTAEIKVEMISGPFTVLATGPDAFEVINSDEFVLPDAELDGYILKGYSDGEKIYSPGETYTANKPRIVTALWSCNDTSDNTYYCGEDKIIVDSPADMNKYCAVAYYSSPEKMEKCVIRKTNICANNTSYISLGNSRIGEILPNGGYVKVMFMENMQSLVPVCEPYVLIN